MHDRGADGRTAGDAGAASLVVGFHDLPVAAIVFEDGSAVAVNRAYEVVVGVTGASVLGQTMDALIGRLSVHEDAPMLHALADAHTTRQGGRGEIWCRLRDDRGTVRTLRATWCQVPGRDRALVVFLLPADAESEAKAASEALARAGGALVHCMDENAVLTSAVETLAKHGLIASLVLLVEDDPYLHYGPSCAPAMLEGRTFPDTRASLLAYRPPREVLTAFNPHFHDRRAAFFQHGAQLIDDTYPEAIAQQLRALLPAERMVQAPLFVHDEAYGALVVTGAVLTPSLAGAIELFAELVARAVESVRMRLEAQKRLEELERLQSELVARERLAVLGEAAAVVAHEVRNPVAAILNAVTLLRRSGGRAEEQTELLRMVSEEAGSLETLVRGLLDLGRPMDPRVTSVDLAELARHVIQGFRDRPEQEGRALRVEEHTPPVTAAADPQLLVLAVSNLVRNALQAVAPGGTVVLSVEARDAGAALHVDDDGPGFAVQDAMQVFEPFFTTRATGTGIGLAVVRRVIEAHHGRIELGRSALGGARVTLVLEATRGA